MSFFRGESFGGNRKRLEVVSEGGREKGKENILEDD